MNNELISASISDRGLSEKRPQNEDSFAELPRFGIFAVADGVGGANAGDFASQMAMEVLTEVAHNRGSSVDAEELFRLAITHANRSIHQTAIELPQLSSMATTIVALHLKGNIATIAHVGDSRVYRFTPEGQLFRETNDHSVVEEEVRAGRITPEEALYHPSRNVISRALGPKRQSIST
jgi:protein phosphatase